MWGGALGNCQGGATHFTALGLFVWWGKTWGGTVLLPDFWRFAQHSLCFQLLNLLPICDQHSSSCYPGAKSQRDGFPYMLSLCGSFKWSILKIWQFLLLPQPPMVFTARSYRDLSSSCWNPGLCSLAWGWDRLLPRCPSQLLSTTHERETVHSITAASLHLSACLCSSYLSV